MREGANAPSVARQWHADVERFFGDGTSRVVKWTGRSLRPIQSGRVQQYMVLSLIVLLALAGLIYYFLMRVG